MLLLKLLQPEIVEGYLTSLEFEDMEPFLDHEGEPFTIWGQVESEMMRDDESGPSNRKRPRESNYKAYNEDTNARSHPNVKKPKRYAVILDEREEPGEREDNRDQDLDYNPFFDETLFGDPQKTREEVAQDPKVKKEESSAFNSEEKLLEDEGYPFKRVTEDVYELDGYVEKN